MGKLLIAALALCLGACMEEDAADEEEHPDCPVFANTYCTCFSMEADCEEDLLELCKDNDSGWGDCAAACPMYGCDELEECVLDSEQCG